MYGDEDILDIKVGSDNNYYFLTRITDGAPHLNGVPVTTYHPQTPGNLFLFSTTCEGSVRWSQAIGSDGREYAYNLVLDSKDNVYVGAQVVGSTTHSIFFSPNDSIAPIPNPDAYKTLWLAKYDSSGNFVQKKALQGNVDQSNRAAGILDLYMDSSDVLHFIVILVTGTHLDNNVTVPGSPASLVSQFFLAKYDADFNYISSMRLPIADGTGIGRNVRFMYDEKLDRYYIAAVRDHGGIGTIAPFTYDNKPVQNRSFILAFDGSDGSEVWRREIHSDLSPGVNLPLALTYFNSFQIDDNSDIYYGGVYYSNWDRTANGFPVKIYDPYTPGTEYVFMHTAKSQALPCLIKFNSLGDVQWIKKPK